jgi:hypothetical protein
MLHLTEQLGSQRINADPRANDSNSTNQTFRNKQPSNSQKAQRRRSDAHHNAFKRQLLATCEIQLFQLRSRTDNLEPFIRHISVVPQIQNLFKKEEEYKGE